MSEVNIDWRSIHPLNGSRANGFEELCAQLARCESPPGSRFERKGSQDAGVECLAVFGDGKEWGWQAKYFDTLGGSQWSQIDRSVRTALKKHPRLVRYFVYVPLDRPDARTPDRKSAMERWNEHVQKWKGWASDRGMTVEFIYWGSHELLENLARPQHVGRVRFWFGVQLFDPAWFNKQSNVALKAAGPRYTRELNISLPIATDFEAFGRTGEFFDRIKAHAPHLRRRLSSFETGETPIVDRASRDSRSLLTSNAQAVLDGLRSIEIQPIGRLPFRRLIERVETAKTAAMELRDSLRECERKHDVDPESPEAGPAEPYTCDRENLYREPLYRLSNLLSELWNVQEALIDGQEVAENRLMILTGKAGTGKTHLLCDVARGRAQAGRPTVLLMGQQFLGLGDPWTQALEQLDLRGLSVEEFVGALESAAQAAGVRAFVMIDALNEGSGRLIWPNNLAAFLTHLEKSAWIGTVLSIRSPYEDIVISKPIRDRAAPLTHYGFDDQEYDATRAFFTHTILSSHRPRFSRRGFGIRYPSRPSAKA